MDCARSLCRSLQDLEAKHIQRGSKLSSLSPQDETTDPSWASHCHTRYSTINRQRCRKTSQSQNRLGRKRRQQLEKGHRRRLTRMSLDQCHRACQSSQQVFLKSRCAKEANDSKIPTANLTRMKAKMSLRRRLKSHLVRMSPRPLQILHKRRTRPQAGPSLDTRMTPMLSDAKLKESFSSQKVEARRKIRMRMFPSTMLRSQSQSFAKMSSDHKLPLQLDDHRRRQKCRAFRQRQRSSATLPSKAM
jgi:hypothetical protein